MAEGTIKIKEMEELTELTDNDYFVVDNLQSGVPTKKYKATRVIQMIENVADEIEEKITPSIDTALAVGSVSGNIASFSDGSNLPMPSLKVGIEPLQSGSGDPSPSNVRPISGWDEVNVTRTGKNQFDKSTIVENKMINNNTGEEIVSYGRFSSDYIKVKSSTDYYATDVIKSAQWYCVFYYDKNKNYLSCGELSSTGDTASGVVTTPSNCVYVRLVGITTYKDSTSFVESNQSTTYSAYSGNTYTIDLDGTRYGGELDVVSGVLTVDRVGVDLGTLTWGKSSTEATVLYAGITGKKTGVSPMICDRYKYVRDKGFALDFGSVSDSSNASYVETTFIRNSDFAGKTAVECTTLLSGTQLVYELATPITVTLTPTEIKTLLGANNIWADTGEIIDCEYKRDATAIINSLIARIEALENQ